MWKSRIPIPPVSKGAKFWAALIQQYVYNPFRGIGDYPALSTSMARLKENTNGEQYLGGRAANYKKSSLKKLIGSQDYIKHYLTSDTQNKLPKTKAFSEDLEAKTVLCNTI